MKGRGGKMSNDLTSKQRDILEYIEDHVSRKGYPPSVREICEAVGLKSTSTVHGHLQRLEKKGYIRRDQTKPRAIGVLEGSDPDNIIPLPQKEVAEIPIIGRVAAGEPILASENFEDTFPVPMDFVDAGNYFMLRVKGDSMIEAGIFDRDFVLVRQQPDARNGDYVVAMLDDSATVKTYYREDNRIRLQPENPNLSPIYTNHVEVLGIVKGVFRKI